MADDVRQALDRYEADSYTFAVEVAGQPRCFDATRGQVAPCAFDALRKLLDTADLLDTLGEQLGHHDFYSVATSIRRVILSALTDSPDADYAELMEDGRQLASERDDLIAAGADPTALAVPIAPSPCPTCSGPIRETVGMVCQTCGTDYGGDR